MKCQSAFIFSEDYTTYQFNEDHPFNQIRVVSTLDLLKFSHAIHDDQIFEPKKASIEELKLAHNDRYIEAVIAASTGSLSEEKANEFGLGTEDTPMFTGMHDASSLLVGGSITAVDLVLDGKVKHALNLGGGLHHGFTSKASGFCVYNDAAVAIKYIRQKYDMKVLYVDTDAHHGDGVQWSFYDDPNVCTFSVHETGRYLFPGTGNVNERGIKAGYGYAFNIPIDAFTEDESFIEVYETALQQIAEYFKPDIIITQNGADAHAYDPLSHLCGSMKIYEIIPKLAHKLAHDYCDGKWIALGGGGYDIWRVVPRAWAQIWKIMNDDMPFTDALPHNWIEKYKDLSPVPLPKFWHDEEGFYKPIPRKPEITEKNNQTMNKMLQFIWNQKQR